MPEVGAFRADAKPKSSLDNPILKIQHQRTSFDPTLWTDSSIHWSRFWTEVRDTVKSVTLAAKAEDGD